MDFKLFFAVVKRYKRVVISGTVLAVVLSVLSYGTPGLKGGKPTIIPRGSEVWQGDAEVLISEEGFPYGRAVTQVIPGKGTDIPAQTDRRLRATCPTCPQSMPRWRTAPTSSNR